MSRGCCLAKIVGAVVARNEADRYLKRCLTNCLALCDEIVLLDDGSTDDTAKMAREMGCHVETRANGGWWGADESPARAQLWMLAASVAGPDGWIYVADADHELVGITRMELHTLTSATHATAFACPLWDCWDSDETMRVDGFWRAHDNPRVWLARAFPPGQGAPVWQRKGLHVGHLPGNFEYVVGRMPPNVAVRHLGYLKREDRIVKHRKYLEGLRTAAR